MTFKEFVDWSNKRACDGCWGMMTAITCVSIIDEVRKVPFWKRENKWKTEYESKVMEQIVRPIEKLIDEKMKVGAEK